LSKAAAILGPGLRTAAAILGGSGAGAGVGQAFVCRQLGGGNSNCWQYSVRKITLLQRPSGDWTDAEGEKEEEA